MVTGSPSSHAMITLPAPAGMVAVDVMESGDDT